MILIVDDTAENLFSLKKLLELNRFDVDTANSGEEALKKILRNDYTLIILDVQMPGMDGFEVAESITGYSKSKDIPIIFLSAVNVDKRFITKGYASGAVDYITKPFDPDLLLLRVQSLHKLYEQTRELNKIHQELVAEIEIRKTAESALQHVNKHLERKVQERTAELLELNKHLEESNSELQQYAYLASHDLQEPMRKIATFTNIIAERFLADIPDAAVYMEKIISSSQRMRNLINDLLNFSKLSASVNFISSNLNEIINDAILDLELAIKEKNAALKIDKLPVVDIIPGQMRQVFQNLISNSLKFSKPDVAPVIKIKGEIIAAQDFHAPANSDGNFLKITVTDNGIGFNDIYLDKIFTLFQRLHGKSEFEGTGIGLAIVKKIVEKHNGILTAKSKESKGTSFIIIIPIKQAPATENNDQTNL